MRTYILIKRLEGEIARLNEEIDARIVRGLSYKTLSRRHKSLVEELRTVRRRSTSDVFGRLTRYASVFLM
jgi:uncharacterized protein (DUF1810 family)